MRHPLQRMSVKLTALVIAILLVVGVQLIGLVVRGMRQTETLATEQSVLGLEAQARANLLALTEREAQLSNDRLRIAAQNTQQLRDYFRGQLGAGAAGADRRATLRQTAAGAWFDSDPARVSDIFLRAGQAVSDPAISQEIQDSQLLDALLPTIQEHTPDAAAVYYSTPHGLLHYYPPTNVHTFLPSDYDMTQDDFYAFAQPAANPAQTSIWTAPYLDPAGQGALVTVSTPVTTTGAPRGVISIDLSLIQLAEHLRTIRPTPNGYVFLVDRGGRLIAAPDQALREILPAAAVAPTITATLGLDLSATPSAGLRALLAALQTGQPQLAEAELGPGAALIATAPLRDVGWSVVTVAPRSDITAAAAPVSAAIQRSTTATLRATLLPMAGLLGLALIATVAFSRRLNSADPRPLERRHADRGRRPPGRDQRHGPR